MQPAQGRDRTVSIGGAHDWAVSAAVTGRFRPRLVAGLTAALAAAGTAAAQSVPTYRSIDGRGNNPFHAAWGSAGADYLREASGAHYADGHAAPAGSARPSARLISNLLAAQGDVETADSRGLSTCVYEWGQFLDHDLGLARGGTTEPLNIAVPTGDPFFDRNSTGTEVILFTRSAFDPATGTTSPRQQVNTVTSYIDASHVYGSDPTRAAWLRTGSGGRLKVDHQPIGDLLPFNTDGLANDDPVGAPPSTLRVAGDVRANEQPGLTVLHTVFLREHNWQADRLHGLHPAWDDERLYQEARRWVAAEMQVITYREFLPALMGRSLPPYPGYRPSVNPGLSNAFATAAYRIGHSMVGPDIDVLDPDFQQIGVVELADAFFNPSVIPSIGGVDPVVRYMAFSTMQTIDTKVVDPLRNFLFGPPGAGGFDLAALNIQRGRDHGLGDYNTVRHDFGLPRVTSFSQITSNADVAAQLQSLYGSVNNIDAWVGMLAEDHVPGSSLGPTHLAAFMDQFIRLRDGDRFWYQNNQFTSTDLARLESTRLSDIFARTTGVTGLPPNVFIAMSQSPAPCPVDWDHNGVVDSADVSAFVRTWFASLAAGTLDGDFDGNGQVQIADISAYLRAWYAALAAGGC